MNQTCFKCGGDIPLKFYGKHRYTFPPDNQRCKVFEGTCACGENFGHVVPPDREHEYQSLASKVKEE